MITGHYFKHLRNCPSGDADLAHSGNGAFLALLQERVGERFARISGLNVLLVPVALAALDDTEDPIPHPLHPACAEFVDSDYCRESWQLHLTELKNRPRTHWHTCDFGMHCALVPLVCRGRCPAVFKLVCPNSMMPEDSFVEHVEVLGALLGDFANRNADVLSRALPVERAVETDKASTAQSVDLPTGARPQHAKVLRALEHIEDRLGDPKLTVAQIARELRIHPDYLANLFAKQVGQRMSRYISARRIERAKTLLATTDWPIKRVAHESGFAHPNWFHHVFSDHTGVTPGDYRRNGRAEDRPTATDSLNSLHVS